MLAEAIMVSSRSSLEVQLEIIQVALPLRDGSNAFSCATATVRRPLRRAGASSGRRELSTVRATAPQVGRLPMQLPRPPRMAGSWTSGSTPAPVSAATQEPPERPAVLGLGAR